MWFVEIVDGINDGFTPVSLGAGQRIGYSIHAARITMRYYAFYTRIELPKRLLFDSHCDVDVFMREIDE